MDKSYSELKNNLLEDSKSEAMLEKQFEVLKVAVAVSNASIYVKDLNKNKFPFVSFLPQEVSGYTNTEVVGILNADSTKLVSKEDYAFLCHFEPIMFKFLKDLPHERRQYAVMCMAHELIHKNGHPYPVYIKITPFMLDDDKNVWMIIGRVNLSPKYFNRFFFIEMADTGERFNFDGCKCQMVCSCKPRLTPMQKKVLIFCSRGLLEKEISEELDISVNTIKTHKRNILKALDADNINDAYALANLHSLI